MLCRWRDFGEEHRLSITAYVLKEGKELKFVIKGEHETQSFKKKNKINHSYS